MAARDAGVLDADQVIDVRFQDFRADQIGTVGRIYDALGMELTPEVEGRMRAFLSRHPGDPGNLRRYTFADTGLDEAALRERTAAYQERFDLETEVLDVR